MSETASTTILPNHLKSVESASQKRSLETASTIVPGRKSYNNLKTTHYGLIDWPSASDSSGENEIQFQKLAIKIYKVVTFQIGLKWESS